MWEVSNKIIRTSIGKRRRKSRRGAPQYEIGGLDHDFL
jgi:hypothetical protein